jgi:phosphotransferase system IIA component
MFGNKSTKTDLRIAIGDTLAEVDNMFLDSQYNTANKCFICNNTASYKLVAKKPYLDTAQLQDKGYVCDYCLTKGYINKDDYGIRE